MNAILGACFLLAVAVSGEAVFAQPNPDNWNLPVVLNDGNTKITFEVDSTWHMVHGLTSGISGQAALSNEVDPHSVKVNLKIPVSKFDTDSESRDEELRVVMNEREFPFVEFSANGLTGACTPQLTRSSGSCKDGLTSELKIRDVKKELLVPVMILSEGEAFRVEGKLPVKWAEFNVEDPSMLIASVDPTVEIKFSVLLKK